MANRTPHEEVNNCESSRVIGGENGCGLLGARVARSKVRLAILYTWSLCRRLVADCGKENKPAERQCEGIATRNCQLDI